MRLKVYFHDEYKLCPSLELLNYTDVYRELDKNRDVCWIYLSEENSLSDSQAKALNHDENIKSWEIIRALNLPYSG
jgi:hypothetical protein